MWVTSPSYSLTFLSVFVELPKFAGWTKLNSVYVFFHCCVWENKNDSHVFALALKVIKKPNIINFSSVHIFSHLLVKLQEKWNALPVCITVMLIIGHTHHSETEVFWKIKIITQMEIFGALLYYVWVYTSMQLGSDWLGMEVLHLTTSKPPCIHPDWIQ